MIFAGWVSAGGVRRDQILSQEFEYFLDSMLVSRLTTAAPVSASITAAMALMRSSTLGAKATFSLVAAVGLVGRHCSARPLSSVAEPAARSVNVCLASSGELHMHSARYDAR